ncbi:MAG: hypothetical protein COA78_37435 [Blastopirellula sp.]|nr:MAG: hypothetical protein COA78_37435 [Blastopirellula sp.]
MLSVDTLYHLLPSLFISDLALFWQSLINRIITAILAYINPQEFQLVNFDWLGERPEANLTDENYVDFIN